MGAGKSPCSAEGRQRTSYMRQSARYICVTIQGLACGANLWFGGFPYPVNPGRPVVESPNTWEATGGHGPGEVHVGWRAMTEGLVAWGD